MDKIRIKSKIPELYGLGIDMEKISRFRNKKTKSLFLKRIYTSEELYYCFNKAKPAKHLAGRFVAKESVIKAMALFTKQPISHKNIEIINDKFGIPMVSLKNKFGNKFYFSLSISHTKDMAVAAVIVTRK